MDIPSYSQRFSTVALRRAGTKVAALLFLALVLGGVGVLVFVGRHSLRDNGTTQSTTGEQTSADGTVKKGARIDAILNATEDLKRQSKFGEAKAILEEALRLNAGEASLHAQLAQVNTSLGDYDASYSSYEKAVAAGMNDPATQLAAGTAASAAGRLDRASEHFASAQAAAPTDWQATLFLAQVQVKQSSFAEAKKNLLIAGRLKPDCAICWGTLADLALRENAPNVALDQVRRARDLEPDNVLWRLIEARALKRVGKPEDALLLLIGLEPEQRTQTGVLPLMAECYGLLKRPADAAAMYGQISDRYPDRADYAFEAAKWHAKAGDKVKSRTYGQRALFLGNEEARSIAEAK